MIHHPLYTLICSNEFNQDFKPFLHLFGINAGILLSHLVSKMNFYYTKNLLVDDEWFYRKRDVIEESTALTHTQQRSALKILSEMQVIQTRKKDNPAKTYYKINTPILLFVLHEYSEFKKHTENKTHDKLSEIGRKALQEYSAKETLDQDLRKPYLLMLGNLRSLIKDYIKLNYKKIEFNFSFQNSQKGFLLEAPEEKPAKKEPTKFSFNESILLFPPEFQENEDFKEQWKAWWKIKKNHFKKPVSKHVTKEAAKIFKKNLSIEEVIARLKRAADPEKPYFKCYFDDDKNRTPGSIIKPKKDIPPKKQPEPIKYAAPIVDYLLHFRESVDIDLINQEVNKGIQYTESCYKKQETYEKKAADDYQYQYARRWFQNLPNLEEIIKSYIESIHWIKDPSERLFLWDSKMFKEFRYKLQKEYHKRSWETGELI